MAYGKLKADIITYDNSGSDVDVLVSALADTNSAFVETPQAITANKTIAASTNAGMMGPTVAISSGTTISVGANSLLFVLK